MSHQVLHAVQVRAIKAAIEMYRARIEARRKGCSKSGNQHGMDCCGFILVNEPTVEEVIEHLTADGGDADCG